MIAYAVTMTCDARTVLIVEAHDGLAAAALAKHKADTGTPVDLIVASRFEVESVEMADYMEEE
jgi:hypothetical protein